MRKWIRLPTEIFIFNDMTVKKKNCGQLSYMLAAGCLKKNLQQQFIFKKILNPITCNFAAPVSALKHAETHVCSPGASADTTESPRPAVCATK